MPANRSRTMYADMDFLLALLKKDDWLQESAEAVYRKHREELWTSEAAIIELMILCERENFDVEQKLVALEQLLDVRADMDTYLTAAHYMQEHGLHTFDALHAARCDDDTMLSTDSDYESLAIDQFNFNQNQ